MAGDARRFGALCQPRLVLTRLSVFQAGRHRALAIESIDIPIEERPDLIELLSVGALGELEKPPLIQ
jgi:hypothetical protein